MLKNTFRSNSYIETVRADAKDISKRLITSIVQFLLRLFPSGLESYLIRAFPTLAKFLPVGNQYNFDQYLGRFKVFIDTTYPIERAMLGNYYEPELINIIQTYVNKGNICFDIGANVGAITLPLADKVDSLGRVYSFEPGPILFDRITKNISLNPELKKIVYLHNVGVSNKSGTLFWNEDMNNRGNAGLLGSSGTQVAVMTVDEFVNVEKLQRLDFVKIDVEGMEYEVLSGGVATWHKYKPIIYFETLKEFEKVRGFHIFKLIEELLVKLGYSLHGVGKEGRVVPVTLENLLPNTLAILNTKYL